MSEAIGPLTARLAEEPESLAFLELGEALRRRGQLAAAAKVARGGLSRHPGLADAHDLMARVCADQGDLAGAFEAWHSALRLDPERVGALKGVAFLYFRCGDRDAALDRLRRASAADPADTSIVQAIDRVRGSAGAGEPASLPAPEPPDPVEAAGAIEAPGAAPDRRGSFGSDEVDGLLLLDLNGLRLAGDLRASGQEVGDQVAALLAGASREATRAARLLGIGEWQGLAAESAAGALYLMAVTPDTLLLAASAGTVPAARLARAAERAAGPARRWLEGAR